MSPHRSFREGNRILLVEDNDDHAELVRRSFEEGAAELELVRLSDGEAALAWLEERRGDGAEDPLPGFILLDLRLPKLDGTEVLKVIKTDETLRNIPVVVLSSSEAEADIDKAYRQHVNSYVVKPLDFQRLALLLRELSYYWLDLNRRPGRRRGR